jgi:hypothetical protein
MVGRPSYQIFKIVEGAPEGEKHQPGEGMEGVRSGGRRDVQQKGFCRRAEE